VSDDPRSDPEGMEGPHPEAAPAADDPRLLRLERSVRQLRVVLGVAVAAGAALALASFATGGRLRARELAIEDSQGRVRIALSAARENPAVEHYDAEGRLRISEGVDADGKAGWTLLDQSGHRRAGAAAFADGDAAMALLDGTGKVRIQQSAAADGTAATIHLDAQGRKRIETIATGSGSAVNSYLDTSGTVRLQIGTSAEGEAVMPVQARVYEPADEPEPELAEAPRGASPAAR